MNNFKTNMATVTNYVRGRKVKTKSKQNEKTDKTATTTVAAVTAATSAARNERLQRSILSEQLDALRKQQIQQQKQTLAGDVTRSTTSPFSNGICIPATALFNCCRDVNCRLNAQPILLTQAAAAMAAQQQKRATTDREKDETERISRERSSSYFSHKSSNSNKETNASKSVSQTPGPRDNSPDSGVGSDGPLNGYFDLAGAPLSLEGSFHITLNLDLLSWFLFILCFCTRFYKLSSPPNTVFDEIHYGKYISLYVKNRFFFDQHPPLGKQLIAGVANLIGYNGNYSFPHIGAEYPPNVPIFWLRFVPALCGSLLAPIVYKLLLEARLSRMTSLLGGLLIVLDNALLTQSRFILMESMLLCFSALGLYCLLKFQRTEFGKPLWLGYGLTAACFLTMATCVKYAGFFSGCLAAYLLCLYLWNLLFDARISDLRIAMEAIGRLLLFTVVPLTLYVGIFYLHFQTLHRAGPHDSVMTSAFQASLDGGLAAITRGQPLNVVHGSQITLRHTHGRTCWLHSHAHVYPVRYPDKRGSSHQQQVTCYSFKDVNNWWIVKKPDKDDLVVDDDPVPIKHGDIIQLVHGITSRALNSHDVAAPMTPQSQEVSCYIDYDIKMEGELLWRVEILNKDKEGPIWHAIKSEIRLIHVTTGAALRFTGRQLPDWGFNQHEIVADRIVEQKDTIWNVEEHRYTKTQDQRERERQLLNAEMIPTSRTKLTFWQKFIELQTKMLFLSKHVENHMYSSEPLEWPLLDKGIAYWMDKESNGQIHLLGNILIWYTATAGLLIYAAFLIFYALRRRRLCFDLPPAEWERFIAAGNIFFAGYLIHYLPYFFVDRALFLHHYLPALLFKLLLLCYVFEHIDFLLRCYCGKALWIVRSYRLAILVWFAAVVMVFIKFLPFSYGIQKLSAEEVIALRWKDTWDFILQKNYRLKD